MWAVMLTGDETRTPEAQIKDYYREISGHNTTARLACCFVYWGSLIAIAGDSLLWVQP